ncbi:MAG: TRAP transporter small permease [Limnochordia bacterium]|jgi:TRAP-type C4-dicarboxylate transport system permease small subunit
MECLSKVSRRINSLVEVLTTVLGMTMIGVMLLAIILRYVLHLSPIWTAELTRFLFVWTMLLGVTVLARKENHVCIEIFRERGTPLMKIIFSLVSRGVTLVFSIFILLEGFSLARISMGQVSLDMRFPMGIVYAVIPLSGALMTLHVLALVAEDAMAAKLNHRDEVRL